MGKFTITQDIVNKLKRIKSNNRLFVLRILFDKTKIKTIGDSNKIVNALIGKINNSNLTEFLNGDISASTNVNADPFNKRSIINLGQGVKLDIGKFNKPVPRPGPDEFFFAGDQQIIKIPISGTVIQTSNPGNKNQVRTNLVFANPTFNKRSAEVFARGMGFPVGKITQLPNAIDIKTSQKFNPRNFKFTKNRRINNKIVEKILTNRLI